METLVLYMLLTTAAFYLGSRAKVTHFLWSKYSPEVASFFDCPACSGAWYGLIFGMILSWRPLAIPFLSIEPGVWYAPILIGLCSIVWTPIGAGLMQLGFDWAGSALEDPVDNTPTSGPGTYTGSGD